MTVYLITTGGTIEKVYSEQQVVVLNSSSKIERYLAHLRLPDCKVCVVPLMNKDSLEMTSQDRRKLAAELTPLLPKGHPIVVIHGTDTLVETGLYLQKIFGRSLIVPLILTGAMTPLGFDGSDGLQNLTESIFAARLLSAGVFVVFHGRVLPIQNVRKDRDQATFVQIRSRVRREVPVL